MSGKLWCDSSVKYIPRYKMNIEYWILPADRCIWCDIIYIIYILANVKTTYIYLYLTVSHICLVQWNMFHRCICIYIYYIGVRNLRYILVKSWLLMECIFREAEDLFVKKFWSFRCLLGWINSPHILELYGFVFVFENIVRIAEMDWIKDVFDLQHFHS